MSSEQFWVFGVLFVFFKWHSWYREESQIILFLPFFKQTFITGRPWKSYSLKAGYLTISVICWCVYFEVVCKWLIQADSLPGRFDLSRLEVFLELDLGTTASEATAVTIHLRCRGA